MDVENLKVGDEVLVVSHHYGACSYRKGRTYTTVVRTTKARVFVRSYRYEGSERKDAEREFDKKTLKEYGQNARFASRIDDLIIDPALIADERAIEAAENVTKGLKAEVAKRLQLLNDGFSSRYDLSDEKMRAFIAAVGPLVGLE